MGIGNGMGTRKGEGTIKLQRTHNCNELTKKELGKTVTLMGWVENRRDHGGLIFVDLRDREGLTQVVFDPSHDAKNHALAGGLRNEWVMAVSGQVKARPQGMANPKLKTGEVELRV